MLFLEIEPIVEQLVLSHEVLQSGQRASDCFFSSLQEQNLLCRESGTFSLDPFEFWLVKVESGNALEDLRRVTLGLVELMRPVHHVARVLSGGSPVLAENSAVVHISHLP